MPGPVEIGLLGPVVVRVDGADVALASAPQRVLLARLALAAGKVVGAASLIDAVWGENPPENADKNVHVYISRLRRVVGVDRINREPGGYRLDVDGVDVAEVGRLVSEARDVAATDVAGAARLLGAALDLWRGEPLSDLPEPLVFAPELARLAEWRLQLSEEWFELRLAAGEAGPALPDLQLAVAADPLRERLSLVMAKALHQVGRTAEALGALDKFRRRLAEESGLDPSPQLEELRRRLLGDDPALRSPVPPMAATGGSRRVAGDDFVGRRVELGRLLQRVTDADAGRGGVVLVGGEPGIGKTRLLTELADVATGHGAIVLSGRCLDGAGTGPYHPFAEVLEDLLDTWPAVTPVDLAAIAPLVPGRTGWDVEAAAEAPLQPDELRLRLLDGVARVLLAPTAVRTVVVVIDDLQWAESSTVAMLRHVARSTRGHRLVLVGAYRSGELADDHPLNDALAELRSETECATVLLAGLELFAVDRLLVATAGRPLAAELVASITAETGGNPFFAKEVVRHLLEENVVAADADGFLRADLPCSAVPEGVRQVIARRRRRLSRATNQLLDAASAVEGPFPFEPVAEVAALDDPTALTALDEALDAGLVIAEPAPDRYDFAHALVRTAVYATLNPSRQLRLHRRLAEALEAARSAAGTAVAPAEVAVQFQRSAALPGAHRGVEPALEAAEFARAAGAHDENVTFLRMARELARPDDARLPDLLARSAIALAWSLRFDEAVTAGREALEATARLAGPGAAAAVAADITTTLAAAGSNRHAWELTPRGLALAGEKGAEPAVADPPTWAALTVLDVERREAADPANPGIPMDVPERREALRILGESGRFAGRADLGRYAVAAVYGSRAQVPESAAEDPTVALLLLGDFAAALPRFEADAETAHARGQLVWELYCRSCVARCHTALGDLAAAATAIQVADALAARAAGAWTSWQLTTHLGSRDGLAMALDTGWEQALAAVLPLLQSGLPEHQWATATLQAAAARTYARLGQAATALPLLVRPVRALASAPAWAPNYLRTACDVAETLWLLDARDHLTDTGAALQQALHADFRFPMMDARLALARLRALDGCHDEARRWFAAARTGLEAQSARPLRAVVDHDEALMHARLGDHVAPRPFAAAAAEQFRELGMTGWIRRLSRVPR